MILWTSWIFHFYDFHCKRRHGSSIIPNCNASIVLLQVRSGFFDVHLFIFTSFRVNNITALGEWKLLLILKLKNCSWFPINRLFIVDLLTSAPSPALVWWPCVSDVTGPGPGPCQLWHPGQCHHCHLMHVDTIHLKAQELFYVICFCARKAG